ncbi:MAG: LEA type 2 family protein [Thiopseudomonas sp.]
MNSLFLSKCRAGTRHLLLFVLVTFLTGCSTWFSRDFHEPEIQLTNIELVYARLLEQEFLLEFRIDNPNEHSLPVRGMTYNLDINGFSLGRGQSNQWLTVPANGSARFELRAHTNLWRHLKNLVALLKNPDQPIRYSLDAELKTGLMFNKKVPVRRQGSFTPGEYLNNSY